jgi:hypothetical protein
MVFLDVQTAQLDQELKTAQPEESAHHLLQSTVTTETADNQALNASPTLAQVA